MTRPLAVFALFASLLSPLAVNADNLPQRWVSAGGSLSEWVVELGGEDKLAVSYTHLTLPTTPYV